MISEGATSIVDSYKPLPDNRTPLNNSPPLDLSAHDKQPNQHNCDDGATSDTANQHRNVNPSPAKCILDPYLDAQLSGLLEKINIDIQDYMLMEQFLNPTSHDESQETSSNQDQNLSTNDNTISATSTNKMMCMVKLDQLTDTTISKWITPCKSSVTSVTSDNAPTVENLVGPYGLCIRLNIPRKLSRFDRTVKQNIYYKLSSESSQDDEDFECKLVKWSRPRQRNIAVLSSGPSSSRMQAQAMINKCREEEEAQMLLSLRNDNRGITGDNSSNNSASTSTSSGSSGNATSDNTDDESTNDSGKVTTADVNNASLELNESIGDDNHAGSTKDSDSQDDIPLSVVREQLDDDLPPSVLKKKLAVDGKPTFKTKSYELFKYKRKRIFKCLNCDFTGTSEKVINQHFRDTHGLLTCLDCGGKFNTVSALRKHCYDHTDQANTHVCKDCKKSFAFPSRLKSHRKTHLTALEHHCLHCEKSFKNRGELVKHQVIHSGKIWKCQEQSCKYECNNPKNLRAHTFSHAENNRNFCKTCKKGFKYYQQLKCHLVKPCAT